MAETPDSFIVLARHLASNNDFKRAFDMYRCAFDKQPSIKEHLYPEFRTVFTILNESLAEMNDEVQIFSNFVQALLIYPNNVHLFNDLGQYLNKYGYTYAALCNFERAMNIDSSYPCVENNLNKTKASLLPRRHFRVLNDKYRNEAYRKAIKKCVTPRKDNVLDLLAGVGLLTLYAIECNPNSILVFETSEILARIAEEVFKHNNVNVEIMQSLTDLENSANEKTISVLMTDSIDSALFGGGILYILCHAWEDLLAENSTIIPGKAEFFVVGIKCDDLNNKYKLSKEVKVMLNIENSNVHVPKCCGYYSEDIELYNNLEYITEPICLFTIDFNNYHEVHAMLNRKEAIIADLLAVKDSEINSIVGYFNLQLADDIHLTSNPRDMSKSHAYQQAVFYDIIPTTLQKNEHIKIPFTIDEGILKLVEENTDIARINLETIAFLNDSVYMDMIEKCTKNACVYLGQIVNISEVDIVDLTPFPVFGILMLKRGANSLICYVETVNEKILLQKVLIANEIELHRVTVIISEIITGVFSNKKFHVIFHNIIQFNGDIDVKIKTEIQILKQDHLVEGGLCLPEMVTMMAQLINSKTLELNNKLLDQNVGCDIAKDLNRYQTSKALNLNISRLEYEPLSEEFKVDICSDLIRSGLVKTLVTSDGECNGIICWYRIQMMDNWEEFDTKRCNSFVNSIAYLLDGTVVIRGNEVNVLKRVDSDISLKLVLDV